MIIGITGTDGAGKGTVVDYLVQHKGFRHYHGRPYLTEEIKKRGMDVSRVNMRLVANELRALYGNDYLVTHFLKKIEDDRPGNAIIDSLRALAEAKTLKKYGGILIAIDADPKIRYERVQSRRSETDRVSYEQFLAHEELETTDPDPHGMQKRGVMALADHTILNNGTLTQLEEETEKVFQQILSKT